MSRKTKEIMEIEREDIINDVFREIIEEFRKEEVDEQRYRYAAHFDEHRFVTVMSTEELHKAIEYAADIVTELHRMNETGEMSIQRYKELETLYFLKAEEDDAAFQMLSLWQEEFRTPKLSKLIVEVDKLRKIGGAYAEFISNPLLIAAILSVYSKAGDRLVEPEVYGQATYFLTKAIMKMDSEEGL